MLCHLLSQFLRAINTFPQLTYIPHFLISGEMCSHIVLPNEADKDEFCRSGWSCIFKWSQVGKKIRSACETFYPMGFIHHILRYLLRVYCNYCYKFPAGKLYSTIPFLRYLISFFFSFRYLSITVDTKLNCDCWLPRYWFRLSCCLGSLTSSI